MPRIALGVGVILIVLGLVAYFGTGMASMTALIPSGFGVLFCICGALALKPNMRKHAMHVASVIALVGFIGAPMRTVMKAAQGEAVGWASTAVLVQIATSVVCLIFLILAVRSFIHARRSDLNSPEAREN